MIPINEPYRVTSKFREKRDLPPWGVHYHDGVDLVSGKDKNVYNAAEGVVTSDRDTYDHAKRWVKGSGNSVGNRVIIKSTIDGDVYYVAYYHLVSNTVSVGQKVKAGELIGVYGDVGMSYGAHLHFMVWDKNWKVVDPEIILKVV